MMSGFLWEFIWISTKECFTCLRKINMSTGFYLSFNSLIDQSLLNWVWIFVLNYIWDIFCWLISIKTNHYFVSIKIVIKWVKDKNILLGFACYSLQVFVKLDTKEQIVTNVIQDTMVMALHVLPVVLTRLHLQVVLLQLQQNVSFSLPSKSKKLWHAEFNLKVVCF